jgi:hypothetical protein
LRTKGEIPKEKHESNCDDFGSKAAALLRVPDSRRKAATGGGWLPLQRLL